MKVYCSNCKYFKDFEGDHNPIVRGECKHPSNLIIESSPINKITLCSVVNKDNDCKLYEASEMYCNWLKDLYGVGK